MKSSKTIQRAWFFQFYCPQKLVSHHRSMNFLCIPKNHALIQNKFGCPDFSCELLYSAGKKISKMIIMSITAKEKQYVGFMYRKLETKNYTNQHGFNQHGFNLLRKRWFWRMRHNLLWQLLLRKRGFGGWTSGVVFVCNGDAGETATRGAIHHSPRLKHCIRIMHRTETG